MSKNIAYIKTIVEDYDTQGFAKKNSSTSLTSLDEDNDTVVDFSPLEENGEVVGLEIISNGDLIKTLKYNDYEDQDFVKEIYNTLASELNF